MKRVLITGAGGFVGRHCVPVLLAKGYEVHAVSRSRRQTPAGGVVWHPLDLLARGAAEFVADVRPTHLLHLAWDVRPGLFWTAPENVAWVQASLDLVRAFAQQEGRRAVIAGTCAEYDWNFGYCDEATTPLVPATLYGACKHALRLIVEAFAARQGFSAAWCRLFFVYGPKELPQRFVPSVIRALLRGEPACCTHGRQVRDFLHAEDVADALVAVLESEVAGAINIGSGQAVTLAWIASQLAGIIGRPDLLRLGALKAPPGDPSLLLPVVARLVQEVGWSSRVALEQRLQETVDWYRKYTVARAA
jgi:nucleoside-diphosphate-sugar epimerase